MEIDLIHSFLVHPGKHLEDPPDINGTNVAKAGRLYDMLKKVFDNAEEECQHDVAFSADHEGKQNNECRNAILGYLNKCDISHGRQLAQRLQAVTTNRSGLGLLFLMKGSHKGVTKIVVSRFPADSGILAQEMEKGLTVEFLERIFMKSATSYKAAVYSGKSHEHDFWKGKAGDKQINSAESYIASYWIRDFLHSDFLTPGQEGTRRFASAVREAMNRSTDTKTKEEITALTRLLPGLNGKIASAKGILDQFHVSDETQEQIKNQFRRQSLFDEGFRFMPDELTKILAFTTIELNNGGLLTAATSSFDKVFAKETIDSSKDIVRYTTQGTVVDQRFRKEKS